MRRIIGSFPSCTWERTCSRSYTSRLLLCGLCLLIAFHAAAEVSISEIDSDQSGADTREFVELYDGGAGNTSLSGYHLVLFNGADGSAYQTFSLSGKQTNALGYFVIGNASVSPSPGLTLTNGTLQNGPDAAALYKLPNGFPVPAAPTAQNLISAIVYGNSNESSANLAALNGTGNVENENALGTGTTVSIQRCAEGFHLAAPTPAAVNSCPNPPANIIINEIDPDQPDANVQEFIELYDGGTGNVSLDGLVVVLFNGATDASYGAIDLAGHTTGEDGYFLIGNSTLDPDLTIGASTLQNGPDAIAIYAGTAASFPAGTALTTQNLIDAVVYSTGEDDAELMVLLQSESAISIDSPGKDYSIQRCPNGTGDPRESAAFTQNPPSPGYANLCLGAAPVAAFTYTEPALDAPVQFTNSSSGQNLACAWTFQDAVPGSSTDCDPVATFFSTGEKFVTLSVSNLVGSDTASALIYIPEPSEGEGEGGEGLLEGATAGEESPEAETSEGEEGEGGGEAIPEGEGEGEGYNQAELDKLDTVLYGFFGADINNDRKLTALEVTITVPSLSSALFAAVDANHDNAIAVSEILQFSQPVVHSADMNGDFTLGLLELLRVIQLYNSAGFGCAENAGATEDGYLPGATTSSPCKPHAADTRADFALSLSELLRAIQLFNLGPYMPCQSSEDHFCQG